MTIKESLATVAARERAEVAEEYRRLLVKKADEGDVSLTTDDLIALQRCLDRLGLDADDVEKDVLALCGIRTARAAVVEAQEALAQCETQAALLVQIREEDERIAREHEKLVARKRELEAALAERREKAQDLKMCQAARVARESARPHVMEGVPALAHRVKRGTPSAAIWQNAAYAVPAERWEQ